MSAFVINPYAFGFNPKGISGLQLWLDATVGLFDATTGGSAVTADAGSVARWEDQSGNGNHVTQATGAQRPELKTSIQNGLNVVRFTAANSDQMDASTTPFSGTTARTFFLVAKATSTGLVAMYGMGGDATITGINFDVTPEIRVRVSQRQDFNLSMGTADFRLLTIRFPSGGNIEDIAGWLDGTAMSGTPTAVAAINTSATIGFRIGRSAQPLVTHCSGDYCEFLGYNTELSNTDKQAVETYLANKWGITI
jgi:hypothetical protein